MSQDRTPTSRQRQAEKSRAALVKVALGLFEKKGFGNTTIEEIARSAGVSVGSFYYYFKSKDEVFFELYRKADDYFKRTVARNLGLLAAEGARTPELVVQYFRHYARYNRRRGFDNITQLYNTKNGMFAAKGRYMQRLLTELIGAGQAAGELDPAPAPEELTDFFFIAARGVVYDWCIHGGAYDLVARMEQYMRKLVGSALPR